MRRLYRLYFILQRAVRRVRAPVTLGTRALVIKDHSILLVRMTYVSGWYLPGGGVDRGESFDLAVRRELAEECGVHAEKASLFGLYLNTADGRIDHVAVYQVEEYSGQPLIQDANEISEVKFFSFNDLPKDLWPGHRRRVEEYLGRTPRSHIW